MKVIKKNMQGNIKCEIKIILFKSFKNILSFLRKLQFFKNLKNFFKI